MCQLQLVVMLLLACSVAQCEGRMVGSMMPSQDMESEEVELVYEDEAEGVEMVSAFVLESSGKISFGRQRQNLTANPGDTSGGWREKTSPATSTSRGGGGQHRRSKKAGQQQQAGWLWLLSTPLTLLALLHLLGFDVKGVMLGGSTVSEGGKQASQREDSTVLEKKRAKKPIDQINVKLFKKKRKVEEGSTASPREVPVSPGGTRMLHPASLSPQIKASPTPEQVSPLSLADSDEEAASKLGRTDSAHTEETAAATVVDDTAASPETSVASPAVVECGVPCVELPRSLSWADIGSDSEMEYEEGPLFQDSDDEVVATRSEAGLCETTCEEEALSPTATVAVPEKERERAVSLSLHSEVEAHAAQVEASMSAQEAGRQEALQLVANAVAELWPCGESRVYGSMYGRPCQRLALPLSDIDIVVCRLIPRPASCTDGKLLHKLEKRLRQSDAKGVGVIHLHGCSVLRLTVLDSFSLDLTIDSQQHRGLITSDYTQQACQRLPLLRPLALVIKRLLRQHSLHDPYSGGLCGYGVTLLAARYLLDHPDTDDLGVALHGFLSFFGERFDPRTMGVRVRSGESYILYDGDAQTLPAWGSQPLFIEDPEERGNNVGTTAWRFPQIQQLFLQTAGVLETEALHALWTAAL